VTSTFFMGSHKPLGLFAISLMVSHGKIGLTYELFYIHADL